MVLPRQEGVFIEMCGIAGMYSANPIDQREKNLFSAVLKKMKHRGYSLNEKAQLGDFCLLGANRLEIVDADNGKQPFLSKDRRIGLVFNGEIYNFIDLRNQLREEGYKFKTYCDTEVLLRGYECWGVEKLCAMIRGIFAFIIYDGNKREIVIASDPFGVKPMYWAMVENDLLFASEVKALIDLNTEIQELGPGEISIFKGCSCSDKYYFTPRSILVNPAITFQEASRRLKELVSQAVYKRVQTDLPVAVLLGGVDSGIVLSQAVKYHKHIKAYTIGRNDEVEDVRFARKLCSEMQVPLKVLYTDEQEILSLVPEVIRCIESFEPNHIRGGTFSYLLARQISRDGFRIILCGEGADELFAGYSEFVFWHKRGKPNDIISKRLVFVEELYKTQLKRVDRTSMAFTIETRVPFLDLDLACFALSLPSEFLLQAEDGHVIDKFILREAFKDELPSYALTQEKRVLSAGAGFSTNAEEGPFFAHAVAAVDDDEYFYYCKKYPEAHFRNKEEVYYFKIFENYYPANKVPFILNRPFVNRNR